MLFQIAAFLIQFLSLPAFGIYFTLSGIGMVYQVSVIYIKRISSDNNQDASTNGFIATLLRFTIPSQINNFY